MINKDFTYAVIGASNNKEKYGYKIYKDLHDAGFSVVAVHPTEKEIDGMPVYASLASTPQKIDVVITVVPPVVTEKVVEDMQTLGIKKIWMQPGSQSEKAIQYCQNNGIEVVHEACIMIKSGLWVKHDES